MSSSNIAFPFLKSIAILLASVAAYAALMLVLQHLGGLQLPGCGTTSACAQLSESKWGSIAGWPVSYLGLAYFAGLVVAFTAPKSRTFAWLNLIFATLGGIVSLGFLGIMAAEDRWCGYCITTHLCNFGIVDISIATICNADKIENYSLHWSSVFLASSLFFRRHYSP